MKDKCFIILVIIFLLFFVAFLKILDNVSEIVQTHYGTSALGVNDSCQLRVT